MALTIETIDGETTRTYRVKDYDELTIADWRALTTVQDPAMKPKDAEEAYIELLKRHTGITKKALRKLAPSESDKLIAAIAETMTLALSKREGEPEYAPPDTIEHEGITYRVPNKFDPDNSVVWEKQTVAGQWFDLKQELKKEHEADLFVGSLAVLLVQQGQEYEPTSPEKLASFERFPLHVAFDLCAFFFDNSQRYRDVTNRFLESLRTSVAHRMQQEFQRLRTATESSQR